MHVHDHNKILYLIFLHEGYCWKKTKFYTIIIMYTFNSLEDIFSKEKPAINGSDSVTCFAQWYGRFIKRVLHVMEFFDVFYFKFSPQSVHFIKLCSIIK